MTTTSARIKRDAARATAGTMHGLPERISVDLMGDPSDAGRVRACVEMMGPPAGLTVEVRPGQPVELVARYLMTNGQLRELSPSTANLIDGPDAGE